MIARLNNWMNECGFYYLLGMGIDRKRQEHVWSTVDRVCVVISTLEKYFGVFSRFVLSNPLTPRYLLRVCPYLCSVLLTKYNFDKI